MNVLDENIRADQREQLRDMHIAVRQIGVDVGRKGLKDHEIVPFLLQLPRPTFFTCDSDFFRRSWCHARYCLVSMSIEDKHTSAFVRRLLRHPDFNTEAKRMGAVIRVSHDGLTVWRLHAENEMRLDWMD